MPVTYRIDTEKGIIRITVKGQPGPDEHAEITQRWLKDPDYMPGMPILIDNRQREEPSTRARVEKLAIETQSSHRVAKGTRVAIVVASDVEYGMSRMYALLSENNPFETHAFYDIAEAEAWLVDADHAQ
jgi:hypothetical protein